MKISTSIGMHSGRALPLNYQYTWAFDASKQTSLTDPEITGYDTFSATIVDDGINIDFNASTATGMAFQEADFTAGSISGGSGTQVIPDGSAPATASDATGHPGRFFSTVATIHDLTIADGEVPEIFSFVLSNASSGIAISRATLGSDPSHINGVARALTGSPPSLAMTQSEINSFVGRPLAITYDLLTSQYFGTGNDDPLLMTLYPAFNENVDMNATIHGFILSNEPPVINYLPVEINNSTL